MKSFLFAAFTFSFILVISAQQCDLNAILTCTNDYTDMITSTSDPAELLRLTREFCQSTCVTTTFPACTSLDPSIGDAVNQIMQACEQAAGTGGASSIVYSFVALFSSVILAGVAAILR